MSRLAVVGSRDFPYRWMVYEYLSHQRLGYKAADRVVSGGAKGVDSWAADWALESGVETTVFLPDWEKYGKSAGYRRNVDIINEATRVVAFQYNNSKGTQHSIDLAKKHGKPCEVIHITHS